LIVPVNHPRLPPSHGNAPGAYQPRNTVDVRAELQAELIRRRSQDRRNIVRDRRAMRRGVREAAMIELPVDMELEEIDL